VIQTHKHTGNFRNPCSTRRNLWRSKAMAETPIFAMKKTSEAEVYLSKRSQTTMYQTELNMKAASVVTPTAKKFILSLNWPFFYYG